jgi:hypothetical protein
MRGENGEGKGIGESGWNGGITMIREWSIAKNVEE